MDKLAYSSRTEFLVPTRRYLSPQTGFQYIWQCTGAPCGYQAYRMAPWKFTTEITAILFHGGGKPRHYYTRMFARLVDIVVAELAPAMLSKHDCRAGQGDMATARVATTLLEWAFRSCIVVAGLAPAMLTHAPTVSVFCSCPSISRGTVIFSLMVRISCSKMRRKIATAQA